jgi:hypothetical protein
MRRAALSWSLESLVILGLIASTALILNTYIMANADGSRFMSKVYAIDLASTIESMSADGNVVLRYDNLHQGNDLQVRFTRDAIEVGENNEDYFRDRFGTMSVEETTLDAPSFVLLQKVGDALSVGKTPQECPPILFGDRTVAIRGSPKIEEAMTLAPRLRADGDITITVRREGASENGISVTPAHPGLACLIAQRTRQLSLVNLVFDDAQTSAVPDNGSAYTVTFRLRNDVTLTDEQLGKAVALAVIG